jgi:release factor glutamine methyltransferase
MTVYTPREDSFLLRDHIQELDLEGKKVLDMGTGSGVIAIAAAEKGAKVVAADVNTEALEHAQEKAMEKGLDGKIEFVESDLFTNIESEFDLILFNPPYLPGEKGLGDEEIWRGGEKGVEVTSQFLESASNYVSEAGQILVILSSHADLEELMNKYSLEVIGSEKLWFETLYLARSK